MYKCSSLLGLDIRDDEISLIRLTPGDVVAAAAVTGHHWNQNCLINILFLSGANCHWINPLKE
jgi:hypothetical protein